MPRSPEFTRLASLCSVSTVLLAWCGFLVVVLTLGFWLPSDSLWSGDTLQPWQKLVGTWGIVYMPALLAVTACISGTVAIVKRRHLTRSSFIFAVIGIVLGSLFLLGFLILEFGA